MILKKAFLFIVIAVAATAAMAQYKPVDKESSVKFTIKNFGINTNGTFTGLQGNIVFDINNLNTASFNVSIDASTVSTGNNMRDDHLREESYFDVKNYPRLSFVSTKIATTAQAGVLQISGKLTIKNVTKDISFPFTAVPAKNGYIFKGTVTINRRDFGVGGGSTISDNLQVQLSIAATK